jgi:hypothetical protein
MELVGWLVRLDQLRNETKEFEDFSFALVK